MIYAERIRQAREISGKTQKQLALEVGIAQSTIAHIETGRSTPAPDTLEAIAVATGVKASFFSQAPLVNLQPGSMVYRARKTVTAAERDRARQYAQLEIEQVCRMAAVLDLPPVVLPTAVEDPVLAARRTRQAFRLTLDRPIGNVINAAERGGVVVIALPFQLEKLDAFSSWTTIITERPVIVISAGAPGDRLRFSTAHELGHLVLHHNLVGDVTAMENEANRFASEFLLPEEPMRALMVPEFNLANAARLKIQWGTSMQVLVRRARDLGIITERRYRYLFERISAQGWRKREPANLDIPVEQPRTFRKMVEMMYGPLDDSIKLAGAMHVAQETAHMALNKYAHQLSAMTLEGTDEYRPPLGGRNLN